MNVTNVSEILTYISIFILGIFSEYKEQLENYQELMRNYLNIYLIYIYYLLTENLLPFFVHFSSCLSVAFILNQSFFVGVAGSSDQNKYVFLYIYFTSSHSSIYIHIFLYFSFRFTTFKG